MEKILLAQFIAHVVADFFAQPECFSREKQNKCLGSRHIYIHTLIVFVSSLAMTLSCGFIWYALSIAVIHFLIDAIKCVLERWIKKKKGSDDELYTNHYIFFVDQILHLAVIYAAVAIYWIKNQSTPVYLDVFTIRQLLIIGGFLLCMKPANVFIRSCLSSLNLNNDTEKETEKKKSDLERAGRWIGTLERIMAMVLVLSEQFTAIGFIIAAKSVLRYNESRTGKTEYVLIGTLLSFGIALLIGIGIKGGFFESVVNYISGNFN